MRKLLFVLSILSIAALLFACGGGGGGGGGSSSAGFTVTASGR